MGHIFVSYPHSDSAFVSKLVNDLLDAKYAVWQDSLNLSGGTAWEKDIFQAIDDCEVFLLVWTSNMEGSDFAKKEKDRAMREGKTIIPIIYSGDPQRVWDDIQHLQWIDFRTDYNSGWNKLTKDTDIHLPRIDQEPPNLTELIDSGKTKFEAAAKLWRTKVKYKIDNRQYIGLLTERSVEGIQVYLVGESKSNLSAPDAVQIFLNFSGEVNRDRFSDFLDYAVRAHPRIWTILVRGTITTTNRGLEYMMPDNDQNHWQRAVRITWEAIGKVGGVERTPLHLYMNAPVALGAAICAAENFRRPIHIYQLSNFRAVPPPTVENRYFKAYEH